MSSASKIQHRSCPRTWRVSMFVCLSVPRPRTVCLYCVNTLQKRKSTATNSEIKIPDRTFQSESTRLLSCAPRRRCEAFSSCQKGALAGREDGPKTGPRENVFWSRCSSGTGWARATLSYTVCPVCCRESVRQHAGRFQTAALIQGMLPGAADKHIRMNSTGT